MEKYVVLQGNMTSQGTGDYWTVDAFDNFEEAFKCMQDVSEDIKGITKHPHGYLETIIFDIDDNEDIASLKYHY